MLGYPQSENSLTLTIFAARFVAAFGGVLGEQYS
jgi:hypothetical protein